MKRSTRRCFVKGAAAVAGGLCSPGSSCGVGILSPTRKRSDVAGEGDGRGPASTIHSDEYKALLVLVREARERSGLRQSELADRLGRTQSWVSKIEMGEHRLDLEELRQVCVALDIDMIRLVRAWLRMI